MRTTTVFLTAAVILFATAVMAADATSGTTQLSVFTSNLGYSNSYVSGERWEGGFGLALSHAWTEQWSAEAAVALEQHRGSYTLFTPYDDAGHVVPSNERRSFHVLPVDLSAHYRFTNDTRWTPYISGGVRYVASPSHSAQVVAITPNGFEPVQAGFGPFANRTSAQIGIGTAVTITPHIGLRFDVARLLRQDGVIYDPLTRGSLGISWRF